MQRPNHASRFEGIAKTKLQASRASDTETLQSQVNKAAEKRLSLSGLEILHGRLTKAAWTAPNGPPDSPRVCPNTPMEGETSPASAGLFLSVGTLSRKSVRTVRRSLLVDARKLWRSCWRRCHKVRRSLFRKVSSSWSRPASYSRNTIHCRSQQHLRKPRCGMRGDMPSG